ncbi:MAG: type I DNA topoisomerase [Planctomycetaceae bacterium]|nr:type I DNA topoisomerase [Planctomycetaceae bacterium]
MSKAISGKNYSLVIVESPAKARTIGAFLGKEFKVEASIGHIRDLPGSAKEVPAKFKKEKWGRLGVNVDDKFQPIYVVPDDKRKNIKRLGELISDADEVYLATDEDREGEAISWHLVEELKPKVPVKRLVFHEITKSAIEAALQSPRQIDENLVNAQEARRIIDRLYGYEVSPLLWQKVRPKLSAGRVQSVAVRLVVERERERMAFHSASYWDLLGIFSGTSGANFNAALISIGGKKIPSGKDFDASTGKLFKPQDFILLNETDAAAEVQRLLQHSARVKTVEEKPYTERPYAPFTTSTLQQEANRKLGFTAKMTMSLAQNLYENGYITYMRTDSTNLSSEAIKAARNHIKNEYGDEYLPAQPRYYQSKEKNAQEAHEAIRPAGSVFDKPESLRYKLSSDAFRLYDLIWKRTIACQMNDARGFHKQIVTEVDDALFSVSGKTILFAGYMRAYVEGSDDPEAELADRETLLPNVKENDALTIEKLEPKAHTTMPPPRYSEASLTKVLTDKGIGRPSTYASILETILQRNYVFKLKGALVPTWTAIAVIRLMEKYLEDLIDYGFTAEMEDQLDAVSRGELDRLQYLTEFYRGDSKRRGLRAELDHKKEEIDPREVCTIPILNIPEGTEEISIRIGKFGPFLQQGENTGNIPDELPPDELTLMKALELLQQSRRAEESLGIDPASGKPVFLKNGRFGPYIQLGKSDDVDKRNASLLTGMKPENVDFETALKLLSLPRYLGLKDGNEVTAQNGKYGPYVSLDGETRSLPANVSPLDITLEQALEILTQPRITVRTVRRSTEPLKTFDVSPVTNKPVRLIEGRYGKYLTDGTTNATIPKEISPDGLTFEMALDLLAERAARGPSKRRVSRRSTKKAVKKAPKKKTKKKKTAKKAVKKETG